MIPIDTHVSRSGSKVKPIVHMLGKGGISVLQTSVFIDISNLAQIRELINCFWQTLNKFSLEFRLINERLKDNIKNLSSLDWFLRTNILMTLTMTFILKIDLNLILFVPTIRANIVAAFRGMHVSPAKHSYAWLWRKCDYRTDKHTHAHTDRRRTKWSLCAAMLRRQHNKTECILLDHWKICINITTQSVASPRTQHLSIIPIITFTSKINRVYHG